MTDTPNTGATTKVPDLALHDLCKIMPAHTKEEFDELMEDIRKNKLQHPIMTYEGKILDGRGRYNACVELAKERIDTRFRTELYTGPDPRKYVVSANVKRRHLSESQRALIATQLANFAWGGDRSKAPIDVLTRNDAAHLLNVSNKSVERAGNVLKNGAPAVVEAVKAGKLKVSAAENFAKSDQQDKLIAECNGDVVKAVGKLPKPQKVAKPMTPNEERNWRKQVIDELKFRWSTEFTDWQRRYFVKLFKDDIAAILKDIDEWQGVVDGQVESDGEAVPAQTTDAAAPVPDAAGIAAAAKSTATGTGLGRRL